jgi:hypothetical protein
MSDPTPTLRGKPGLSPDQAADIVAKAIIDRPRTLQPWWAWPAGIALLLPPRPLEAAMRLMYRFSTDSPSAQGIQQ